MEDFVPFDLAVKLKDKGFNIPFYFYYRTDDELLHHAHITNPLVYGDKVDDEVIIAPTISQVLKWLRGEKKIHIEPCILADADTDADGKVINEFTYWSFSIMSIATGDMIYFEYERIDFRRFDTYEHAAIAGIEYVLDNLI